MSTARQRKLTFLMTLLILLVPNAPFAQQALVRSYENPDQIIGQAYLTHYGDQCIALMPTHVAAEAGIPAFLSERSSKLGEAETVTDLGDDLSVALVTGSLVQDCGRSISTISRAIDTLLSGQGLATLRSVNSDGTLANLSVAVVDNDGSMYLRVRPTNDSIQIHKGQSGSLLMVGKRPLGMLLAVNAKYGVGKVLRFDRLLQQAENHMASRTREALPDDKAGAGTGHEVTDLAAAANGGSVVGWNSLPVDSKHRPLNLLGPETAPPWRARVEQWPAEIDVDLAGEKVVISKIELDAGGVPKAERPARVEILINTSSDETRWRSLLGRKAKFDDNSIASFAFAPTWARQVRIAIGASQGGTDIVSLRRLRISNP